MLKGQALPDSRALECAALCAWNLRPPNPSASIHTPSPPSSSHLGNHLLREPREGKALSYHSTFPLVSGSLGFNRLFLWAFTQVPWGQRSLSSVLTNAWHAQEIFVDWRSLPWPPQAALVSVCPGEGASSHNSTSSWPCPPPRKTTVDAGMASHCA